MAFGLSSGSGISVGGATRAAGVTTATKTPNDFLLGDSGLKSMPGDNTASNGGGGGGGGALPGLVSSGMGLVQMAIGLSQLRKANRLPFPGYLAAKGPYAEMKSIYENNMRQGIGSEQRGMMRMENSRAQAQQMNAVSQSSPQASALLGRTAAINRTSGEARILQADLAEKQNAMSGVERMNQAMSLITQKDISAKRDFRLTAERAAGAAIKRGSENIANSIGAGGS
jgi:hypothetical protein